MIAFKLWSIIAFPMREDVHWTHLFGLSFRPFCPDHSETYFRPLIIERPWAPVQGLPTTTSFEYLRKETNDSKNDGEKEWGKKCTLKNARVV